MNEGSKRKQEHQEGVRSTDLAALSKAKLALECMSWVSSKETLAPAFNGRCHRALPGCLLTGFAQDWTKKYKYLHAQCEG